MNGRMLFTPVGPAALRKPPEDGKILKRLVLARPLKKLPAEKLRDKEKERFAGLKPEPPKHVDRPLQDNRIVMVNTLMDREESRSITTSFKPREWEPNFSWLNPDNLNEIQPDKLFVLFGKRRTGKSFLLRWLIQMGRGLFDHALVMTNTDYNGYWQKYFPERFVQPFDSGVLDMFIARQTELVRQWRKAGEPRSFNPYKLIIMDDVVSDKFRYNDVVNDFATRGRHMMTSVALITQYPRFITTATRTNTDYAFVFFQQNLLEKEAIATEYLNMMPVKEAMALIERNTEIDESTKARTVMVIDQMANTTDLNRKIFYCKPEDPGEFVVGSPKFWEKDKRYSDLVQKNAFQAWIEYQAYRSGLPPVRV